MVALARGSQAGEGSGDMKWRWLELIIPQMRRRPDSTDELERPEASAPQGAETPRVQPVEETLAGGPTGVPHHPPKEHRRPASLEAWETLMDRRIREAMERGEFDNLPGAGKPLNLDNNPFAGDWEVGFHLLKQNGFTLPWIELGREIEADRAALRALLDRAATQLGPMSEAASTAAERKQYGTERARYRELYLKAAAELDRKLGQYSAEVPAWWMDQGRLPPHVAARQFDAACPPL